MSLFKTIFESPLFAIALTLTLYWFSLHASRKFPWLNPLLSASVALVALLYVLHIPYERYRAGADWFSYLLGPATVALGVPMYKQGVQLKGALRRLLLVVLVGSIVGMVSAGATAALLGAPHRIVLSTISKSVTTPIAIQITENLRGDTKITIAMVILTGLLGSIFGPGVLRFARILHDHAIGSAIGASSHALGTATLIGRNEVQGAVSSLAMAMAGVMTSILAMLLSLVWN
jgi:predicted murein hydrolase (TIGR00659 family)